MREKSYLTVEEVADRFGVNPTTVYRLAQQGKLPSFKIGGQWRFSQEALEKWVAAREGIQSGTVKDTLVANVSHELRTPLSIIQEGVSQLAEGLLGGTTQEQQESLAIVLKNVGRLRRLIDDLLDISRLEAGDVKLKKEWINLRDLLEQVVSTLAPRVREKGLQLEMHLPSHRLEIYADRDKVTQILTKLMENAVRFTETGSIEISAHWKKNEVECVISDTGVGIAPENFQRLFEKFQQFGRAEGGGLRGTGLGLSIAKKLIELHGGTVRVESTPGKGTTFTLTLPKLPAAPLEKIKRVAA